MIPRRTLLKSVGLILPAIAMGNVITRGARSSLYGIQAVKLDGVSMYGQNDGTIPNMPSTTPASYIRYRYNSSVTGVFTHCIFNLSPSVANKNVIQIRHQSVSTKRNSAYLYAGFGGGNSTLALGGQSAAGSLPMDGRWHDIAIKADTGAGTISVRLDGGSMTSFQVLERVGVPFNMPCLTYSDGSVLKWSIGRYVASGSYYNSSLAEFYGFFGQDINDNDPNVIAAFTNPVTKLPVRNAADGVIQVRDSNGNLIQTLQAQIYLSGGPGTFLMNYPGWTWATSDDFLNGTPGSTFIPGTDTGPSSFYSPVPFLEASSDPWGFTGET